MGGRGMKIRKPYPFVHEITDRHGHRRAYFRKPGCPSVSLPLPVGSRAFLEAFHAALEAAPQPIVTGTRSGTIAALAWRSTTHLASGRLSRRSLSGPIGTFSIV